MKVARPVREGAVGKGLRSQYLAGRLLHPPPHRALEHGLHCAIPVLHTRTLSGCLVACGHPSRICHIWPPAKLPLGDTGRQSMPLSGNLPGFANHRASSDDAHGRSCAQRAVLARAAPVRQATLSKFVPRINPPARCECCPRPRDGWRTQTGRTPPRRRSGGAARWARRRPSPAVAGPRRHWRDRRRR